MTEFIEIIKKDVNVQNEFSQTIDKYNKASFSTRSQMVKSIQSKVFKQAIIVMGETISDLNKISNKGKNDSILNRT